MTTSLTLNRRSPQASVAFGCRLLATFSPIPSQSVYPQILKALLLEADNHLRHQCHPNRYPNRDAHDPINNPSPDGWGLAAYTARGKDALVLKSAKSALEDPGFVSACERLTGLSPQVLLAHVRMASPFLKAVDRNNTHPFVCGPWSLIHNGTVLAPITPTGRQKLRDLAERHLGHHPRGETDSEATLYTLLGQLAKECQSLSVPEIGLDKFKGFLRGRLASFRQKHLALNTRESRQNRPVLNMVLSEGNHLFAVASGTDLYLGRPARKSPLGTPWVVASEPIELSGALTGALAWQKIPDHRLVTLHVDKAKKLCVSQESFL